MRETKKGRLRLPKLKAGLLPPDFQSMVEIKVDGEVIRDSLYKIVPRKQCQTCMQHHQIEFDYIPEVVADMKSIYFKFDIDGNVEFTYEKKLVDGHYWYKEVETGDYYYTDSLSNTRVYFQDVHNIPDYDNAITGNVDGNSL